ncbi:Protein CHLOROPLAST IMPORT APPARATUS 2 [Acorus calamus]|uniref:Protein CHLOROPLAST IMPORT APPARATUS 2 n=1 Tax=Acorus calamus TaxID=4465 RepID=A0AAV9CME8_ACOCL|nr:Protein CHLOROPLAST IMPORT APPARATUS 2 [Acorus calamus]
MSTCISGGGGRAYGFELDIVKPSSPLTTRTSSHTSSSPSSTESSNSPLALSTKRARAPRKRPNQAYTEAAALLSSIYPNVFTTKDLKSLCKHSKEKPFDDPPEPLLLPLPLPALDGHGFLVREPVSEKPNSPMELKRTNSDAHTSPMGAAGTPSEEEEGEEEDDFFGSIFDDGVGEGIESIIGNLSVTSTNNGDEDNSNSNYPKWNPLGLGLFEYRLGLRRALRRPVIDNRFETIRVLDIASPKFKPEEPAAATEKNSKKKKKKAKRETEAKDPLTEVMVSTENLKAGLKLKLNFDGVLNEWSGSAFSDDSSGDAIARLEEIDLFSDTKNGKDEREASVLRYKEKRRTRLFSKKIRYQVRKLNADHRPRIKAR